MGKEKGLEFRKLDLHIHTPASKCFKGTCTPEAIVTTAIHEGLDGIAITDHNTAAWIDKIQDAAKSTNLVVFPGVEISCTGGKQGIHIIGIFDPEKKSKKIEEVLNRVGIPSEEYGNETCISKMSPEEVIEEIYNLGGLSVLAHANSSHGVISDMGGESRINTIQSKALYSIECTDRTNQEKIDKRTRVIDLLSGSIPEYKRNLAIYEASDNLLSDGSGKHGLEGIGKRYTLFKMEKINLDSLRQCFIDPGVRICFSDEVKEKHYPKIEHIRIDSGFLQGQEIYFHEGVTSILGAKGTGKSLLIEFMRFVLNQESKNPQIYDDHISKLRNRLGDFGSVAISVLDENGEELKITRKFKEIDNSPYGSDVPFDPSQSFPVLFLSQNEIIKIAENESEQLKFIDNFFDFNNYRNELNSLEKELIKLDRDMAERLRAFKDFDHLNREIETLKIQLKGIDDSLKNPIFEKYSLLENKDRTINSQKSYLLELKESISSFKNQISKKKSPPLPENLAKDPILNRLNSIANSLQDLIASQLEALTKSIHDNLDKTTTDEKLWEKQYLDGKKEYEGYIQKVGGDYKALALARQRLSKKIDEMSIELHQLTKYKEEIREISSFREKYLDRIQVVINHYTDERKKRCEKFQTCSNGKLKLEILGQSNKDKFYESMLSLKRGSYLKDDEIDEITSTINPREFVLSLLRYEATGESKYLKPLAEKSGIEIKRMKILADFLISSIQFEDLLSLQYKAQPEDRPQILYDIGSENYQPLSSVSVGQKCTAMLIMALSDGVMPVVIDQPEDSLDIRSIWSDVCQKVREGKERRQFIFTTHNSSLAVASDTDCYLILEGDSISGKIVHVGSMDHDPVNNEVLLYLEGGRETYDLKYRKYRLGLR